MVNELIRVEGLAELHAKLRRIPPRVARGVLAAALRTGARAILQQAKINARRPGGTGTLARALTVARDRRARRDAPAYSVYVRRGRSYQMGMRQGRAGSNRRANRNNMDGFYNAFVELGTRPHDIPRGTARREMVMAFERGGSMVFARRVRHPGSRATPFLGSAFETRKYQALQAMQNYIAQRLEREAQQA